MKPKPIQDVFIALTALVIALGAAYWLDRSTWLLVQRASQTFDYQPTYWLPALGQLMDALGLVMLAWWLATRASFPRVFDVLYVLTGLAAALSVPLDFTTPGNLFAFAVIYGGRVSFWSFTGAVLAMAGLFHLFRRRPTIRNRTVSTADPP